MSEPWAQFGSKQAVAFLATPGASEMIVHKPQTSAMPACDVGNEVLPLVAPAIKEQGERGVVRERSPAFSHS
jgi:hypothetical protein